MQQDNWPDTTSSLIEKLKENDSCAWSRFNQNYRPIIKSICRNRFRFGDADANDVTQIVSVNVQQSIHRFEFDRGRGRFRDWVADITFKKAADFLRKKRNHEKHIEGISDERLLQISREKYKSSFVLEFNVTMFVDCVNKVRELLNARGKAVTFTIYERLTEGQKASQIAADLGKSADWVYTQNRLVHDLLVDVMERDYGEVVHISE